MRKINALIKYLQKFTDKIYLNEDLKRHTTFKIGGTCPVFINVDSKEMFIKVLDYCYKHKIEYYILGNGSNVLVNSGGVDKVVICTRFFNDIQIRKCLVEAQSGVCLCTICQLALKNDLSGIEFANNIPGTIGGAVVMNAGAFGSDMSKCVVSVRVWHKGKIRTLKNKNILFNYRQSVFTNNKEYVIISVIIKLTKSNYNEIRDKMNFVSVKRQSTQSVGYASAGSVFNNIRVAPAYMIEHSDLKGLRMGDACVSTIHSGYIVNLGNASSDDVLRLIAVIKKVIEFDWNEKLDIEIKYWEK